MQRNSVGYTVLFSGLVCLVCSLVVSIASVSLRSKQLANQLEAKQRKVLDVAGHINPNEKLSAADVQAHFDQFIIGKVVDLKTGEYVEDVDPGAYDQRSAIKDPALSVEAERNAAGVRRIPNRALIYQVRGESNDIDMIILPIEGMGLWGMMFGYIALDKDLDTVRGITFYEHKETPGLGAEVENPIWRAKWPGRKVFADDGTTVALRVIKGAAGSPEEAPHSVDGLSGATFTSVGVTNSIQFWLGEQGFGPFLSRLRKEGSA